MSIYHMYMGAIGSQKRMSDLPALKLEVVGSCLMWVLVTELDSLEEQQLPLTIEQFFFSAHI